MVRLGLSFLARPLRPAASEIFRVLQNGLGIADSRGLPPATRSVRHGTRLEFRTRMASVHGRDSSDSPIAYRIRVRLDPNPATWCPLRHVDFLGHKSGICIFVVLVVFAWDLIGLDFQSELVLERKRTTTYTQGYPSIQKSN